MTKGYFDPTSSHRYVNLNGRLTRAGHKTPHSEPGVQISIVPAVIPLEGTIGMIHVIPNTVAGPFFTTVKHNIKPITVQVVVIWNGIHDSKCFVDIRDVVC